MKFAIASICTSFAPMAVGTKVTDKRWFMNALTRAMEAYDTTNDRVPGQHYVMVPEARPYVTAGVGSRKGRCFNDFVVREHRGRMDMFLVREHAAPTEAVAVVVYTRAAYVADPEVTPEEVAALGNATHVVVAVLGFAGPNPPLSPYRFVSNLAGGNNEALTYTADDMRRMAKDIKAYDDEWCVVAD